MLLGTLGHGCCRGLPRGLRRGVPSGSNGLSHPLASNVVRIDVRRRANNKTTFKQCQNAKCRNTKVRMQTYRSERRCVAVNLLLVLPVGACPPVSTTCVGLSRGAGGSLVTRPVVVGATSGRLRGLRTNDGAASSSSSSSSSIRTSRQRFGAWLLSDGSVATGEGPPPVASSPPLCPRWSGWGGFAPPHCWCTEYTEQRRPLAGLPPRDSPCQVPVIRTLCTGQRLRSATVTKTSQQLGRTKTKG